jgi:hypothetical protein
MADFKKILDHPEKQKIVGKLVSGEKPKDVAQYLRLKFNKPDEGHLRLPVALLKEFIDTYGDHHGFLTTVIKDKNAGKLDTSIAKSLLENKEWRDRLAEYADDEIDVKKKAIQLLNLIEARSEQVFDKIQQNPESLKGDYVMIKYFEVSMQMIEKLDKIVNERPDMRIEHTHSVQMVDEYATAFQEALREIIQELTPEQTVKFMDIMAQRLTGLQNPDHPVGKVIKAKPVARRKEEMNKLLAKQEQMEGEFVEGAAE